MELTQEILDICILKREGKLNKSWEELAKEYNFTSGEGLRAIVKKRLKREGQLPTKDDGLNSKKYELQKEKIKVQTEKLELNKWIREQSRMELFVEKAFEAIKNLTPLDVPKPINCFGNENKSGILIFADSHYGKELIIKGLDGEILNEYNPEIFEQRMWKILNKTKSICEKENFDTISLVSLGDSLEGCLRIGALMSIRYGIVESAIKYVYFLANWINEMSKFVKFKYYNTRGNHTDLRIITGKKGDFDENIEDIMIVLLKEILKNNSNVEIVENKTDKIYFETQGYKILGIHGEDKNMTQSLKDYSFIYGKEIDIILSGHRHHANSLNVGFSKGCVGVGSIIGIDDFSMSLHRISDPSASFIVVEKGLGKTIEYQINLS